MFPVLLHVIECPRIKNPSDLHVVVPFFIIFQSTFIFHRHYQILKLHVITVFFNRLRVNQEPPGNLQSVIINNHDDWPPTVTACQFRLGLGGSGSPFSTVFFPLHQSPINPWEVLGKFQHDPLWPSPGEIQKLVILHKQIAGPSGPDPYETVSGTAGPGALYWW